MINNLPSVTYLVRGRIGFEFLSSHTELTTFSIIRSRHFPTNSHSLSVLPSPFKKNSLNFPPVSAVLILIRIKLVLALGKSQMKSSQMMLSLPLSIVELSLSLSNMLCFNYLIISVLPSLDCKPSWARTVISTTSTGSGR